MVQQSSFQSLATPPASATGLRNEKKVFKEGENAEEDQNKKWVNETKEKTKNEKWNEWNIDFLFN